MRRALVLLGVLVAVPIVAGEPVLIVGTEDLPELPDKAGDVNYNPAYVGPRNHNYLDITAGWFSHDPAADEIVFALRVADTTNMTAASDGYEPACFIRGPVSQEKEQTGTLFFNWSKPVGTSSVQGTVYWGSLSTAATYESRVVRSRFEPTLGQPAYFRFFVSRPAMLQLGDEISTLVGYCVDRVPTPNTNVPPRILVDPNGDRAEGSMAAYSFKDLRQTVNAKGERLDPIEEFERGNRTASPEVSASPEEDSSTPGMLVAGVLVALAGAALVRKRF